MKQLSAFLIMSTLFATIMFADRVAYAADPTIGPDVATADCLAPYINQTDDGALVKYKARWKANQYTVVFHANATDATGNMSIKTFTYDELDNLPSNEFEREGYGFIGWCRGTPDCAATDRIEDGASINWPTGPNAVIHLYAQWGPVCVALLHIGNDSLCLYKSKITAPSLAIRIENDVYYTAMSPIGDNTKTITSTSNQKLHVKYGTETYNVHDYTMMDTESE